MFRPLDLNWVMPAEEGKRVKNSLKLVTVGAAAALLVGCAKAADPQPASAEKTASDTVKIAVHDNFPNDEFAQAASKATGLNVEVVSLGAEELPGQLVLTKDAPVADLFFGVNNFFASQVVEGGVVEPYKAALPAGVEKFNYDDKGSLTPITDSTVCMNSDPAWFVEKGIAEPKTYQDLLKPEYKDQIALIDAHDATGMAFLAGTIAEFGEDGYLDYWKQLQANGARIEAGWSDAYYGQFSQGGEGGTLPLVLSYASSPAYTVSEDGSKTTSKALLDTCSSVVEYAGLVKGSKNLENAKKVLAYMLTEEFQNTIADTMYVYPVNPKATVPDSWNQFAPIPSTRHDLDAAEISAKRETWLRAWSEAVNG